jgi:hypothetical protein
MRLLMLPALDKAAYRHEGAWINYAREIEAIQGTAASQSMAYVRSWVFQSTLNVSVTHCKN